jgi:hypothetical protein
MYKPARERVFKTASGRRDLHCELPQHHLEPGQF